MLFVIRGMCSIDVFIYVRIKENNVNTAIIGDQFTKKGKNSFVKYLCVQCI